jgi:hypothetical protein
MYRIFASPTYAGWGQDLQLPSAPIKQSPSEFSNALASDRSLVHCKCHLFTATQVWRGDSSDPPSVSSAGFATGVGNGLLQPWPGFLHTAASTDPTSMAAMAAIALICATLPTVVSSNQKEQVMAEKCEGQSAVSQSYALGAMP